MAKLSTHVLDTAQGCPAKGMTIEFYKRPGNGEVLLKTLQTNDDGRTDELLMDEAEMEVGEFELRFHVGDYFAQSDVPTASPAFLNVVPVRFTIFDASQGYHVPLLCSPWSFSTYRGS